MASYVSKLFKKPEQVEYSPLPNNIPNIIENNKSDTEIEKEDKTNDNKQEEKEFLEDIPSFIVHKEVISKPVDVILNFL